MKQISLAILFTLFSAGLAYGQQFSSKEKIEAGPGELKVLDVEIDEENYYKLWIPPEEFGENYVIENNKVYLATPVVKKETKITFLIIHVPKDANKGFVPKYTRYIITIRAGPTTPDKPDPVDPDPVDPDPVDPDPVKDFAKLEQFVKAHFVVKADRDTAKNLAQAYEDIANVAQDGDAVSTLIERKQKRQVDVLRMRTDKKYSWTSFFKDLDKIMLELNATDDNKTYRQALKIISENLKK